MNQVSTAVRPRRREYSPEYKASVLQQCHQPGASFASVALGHGLNPNMVHRWMREHRQRQILAQLQQSAPGFVSLALPAVSTRPPTASMGNPLTLDVSSEAIATTPAAIPAAGQLPAASEAIRMEIERHGGRVTVHWPVSAADQFAHLLRELLR